MPRFIRPEPLLKVFTCPHCDVTATQSWSGNRIASPLGSKLKEDGNYDVLAGTYTSCHSTQLSEWAFSECSNCNNLSVWHGPKMVHPETCPVEDPNEDMPEDVLDTYKEAAKIVGDSPKAAAALLRLGLQVLLEHILDTDSTGKIYDDIVLLHKRNISEHLVKALDIVRINGNESVHPGTVNLNDSPEDAYYLFEILNMVCDHLITQPRRMEEAYSKLPKGKRIIKTDSAG